MKAGIALAALALAASTAAGQQSPLTFGGEKDLTIKAQALLQFRYTTSIRPDEPDDSEYTTGFSFRRARVGLLGKAMDDKLTFEIEGEGAGSNFILLDAWVGYNIAPNLRLRAGQFVLQFDRESLVSPAKQLTTNASSLAYQINPHAALRTQGIELQYSTSKARLIGVFHDGSSSFNSGFAATNSAMAVTVRGEWAALGTTGQFTQMTAPRGTEAGLLFGLAGHYERTENDGSNSPGLRLAYTADVSYQNNGFSAMVLGKAHIAEDLANGSGQPQHVYGVLAQAGYYVTPVLEPYVRYEWATTSDDSLDEYQVLTVGANWYIVSHALKATFEVAYAFDGVSDIFDRSSEGLLVTGMGEEELVLRAQLQVMF